MKTNEVLENIKARRSVRAYTGQQVLEEDLQAILEAATYAPSGMHLETWHFTAIQNMDKFKNKNLWSNNKDSNHLHIKNQFKIDLLLVDKIKKYILYIIIIVFKTIIKKYLS